MTRTENSADDLGYDPVRGTYHLHHDWEASFPLSQTVTYVILALSGKEPSSGPPLSDSVDTDALDQLFGRKRSDDHPQDHLTFTHDGCTVTVYRNGRIVGYPPTEDGETVLRIL